MESFVCSEFGCLGKTVESAIIVPGIGGKMPVRAYPCNICGCLHLYDGRPVVEYDGKRFYKGDKILKEAEARGDFDEVTGKFRCPEKGCDGIVSDDEDKRVRLSRHNGCIRMAFPCEKCGKLFVPKIIMTVRDGGDICRGCEKCSWVVVLPDSVAL